MFKVFKMCGKGMLLKIVSVLLLGSVSSYGAIKYTPIVNDDIVLFVPYTDVAVSLGSDRILGQDQVQPLSASIAHSQEVVSYRWTENGRLLGEGSTFSTEGLGVGVHEITLTVTDQDGLTASDTITVTIEEAMDESDIAVGGGFVGTTKGEFDVSQGTATYKLAVDVPPGTAGMKPELSFAYTSSAANGVMGVGWDIGGVSSITRCAQSEATDGPGHAFGVHYDGNDRFCLDGQRLIAVRGAYGESGTEYRTQIDTYAKIIAHGNSNGGGDPWFEVRTKSGLIYRYGASNNAAQKTPWGVTKFWKVSSIEDSYANTIDFHYASDTTNGSHYLQEVDYADNRVVFTYEDRTDVMRGYRAGAPYRMDKRLKNVKVTTGGAFVREYRLAYSHESTGFERTKLTSITEVVPEGTLKPLYLGWSESGRFGLVQKEMNLPFSDTPIKNTDSYRMKDDKGVQFVDMNGDGLRDIIQLYQRENGTFVRKVCLNTGTTIDQCDNGYTNAMPNAYFSDSNGRSMGTRLADINGDGLPDLIQLFKPDSTYYGGQPQRHVWINTGSGFVSWAYDATLPDAYFAGSEGKDMGTSLADINGDGLIDLIQLYIPNDTDYGGVPQRRVYLNSPTGFSYSTQISSHLPDVYFSDYLGEDMGTRLADMDGDGLVDLIQLYNPDTHYNGVPQAGVWRNTGQGFVSTSYALPDTFFADGNGHDMGTRLADINGDGLVDLIQMFRSSAHYGGAIRRKVYINTGRTMVEDPTYGSSLPLYDYFASNEGKRQGTQLADVNGDGLLDIVRLHLPLNGNGERRVYLNTGSRFVYNDVLPETTETPPR